MEPKSLMKQTSPGVGLVDLDTSHPQAWIPILRGMGYFIAGVYDGGTVYPEGYARQFAEGNDIPFVFNSIEEMARHPDVRIAIVHSCDWDLHLGRIAPFAAEGKAVLVDKPIAGRLDDLVQLKSWAQAGIRIAGGSSLRYAPEVCAFRVAVAAKGLPRAVLAGCGVDEFNYGIHTYSMIAGMLGPGMEAARHTGIHQGMHHVELTWNSGASATLWIGGGAWLPFYATAIHAQTVEYVEAQVETLYRAEIEVVMPYLSGNSAEPPLPFAELIEPELAALAALASYQRDGRWVRLDDPALGQVSYDGAAFGRAYRAAKFKTKG